jgi:hypothetical protein
MKIATLLALLALCLPAVTRAAPGLIGEYYRLKEKLGDEFEVPVGQRPWLVRVDKNVNFPEVAGSFYGSKLTDGFMVRWTGTVTVETAGSHGFATNSDDGSRLYIGDQLVVDNWGPHSMTKKSGSIELVAGTHPIKVIFQEGGGGAGCIVSWKPPGGKEAPIPASALAHDPEQLKAIEWDKDAFAKAKSPKSSGAAPAPGGGAMPAKYGNVLGTAIQLGESDLGPNVSFRGKIIRLNEEGTACMVFDTDTMRMAAGWTDGGLNLQGLPFTGGHGQFPSLNGEALFLNAPAPGWANPSGSFAEPRDPEDGVFPPLGPIPKTQAHYQGLYTSGPKTVLRYTVGEDSILEMPGLENGAITRTIQGEFSKSAVMALADEADAPPIHLVGTALKPEAAEGKIVVRIPAGAAHFKVTYGEGDVSDELEDLESYTNGGPAKWNETITTKGELGDDDGEAAYVLDRLTVPYQNPYGMQMRIGGLDFFTSDPSKAAVSTWDGDVWIVSGIDEKLENLTWKRFAAGGHETLGLTIVDDVIYTVADDEITRYHDLNGDGEADFYENFNNDWELTSGFHAFCFDLQTGPDGDFFFAFGSPVRGGGRSFERMGRHHGSIIRISKDGSKLERYATGLRAPNGIGVSPTGQLTGGDNEGTFVPRCPIHWIDEGEFLGVVDSAADYATMNTTPTVAQRRGDRKQNHDPDEAPMPLAWLPKNVDNSNGGQVWVESDRWGPFEGEMLHFSYGQSAIYIVLKEKKGDLMQGGVVKIPVRPTSSAMRGKFNKRDGQLYLAGLKGWQSNAGREGGLDRVRYTGKPVAMPSSLHVRDGGIEIGFTQKLDPELAEDPESFAITGSDLQWTQEYGTAEFEVGHRESEAKPKGRTKFEVISAKLLPDGKSVFVEIANLQPVHMMQIDIDLETDEGDEILTKIWNTIHVTE